VRVRHQREGRRPCADPRKRRAERAVIRAGQPKHFRSGARLAFRYSF